ncbi:hypothetical protein [Lysobacter sp. A3-1-A15]
MSPGDDRFAATTLVGAATRFHPRAVVDRAVFEVPSPHTLVEP